MTRGYDRRARVSPRGDPPLPPRAGRAGAGAQARAGGGGWPALRPLPRRRGPPAALLDRCPHRFAPLSEGWCAPTGGSLPVPRLALRRGGPGPEPLPRHPGLLRRPGLPGHRARGLPVARLSGHPGGGDAAHGVGGLRAGRRLHHPVPGAAPRRAGQLQRGRAHALGPPPAGLGRGRAGLHRIWLPPARRPHRGALPEPPALEPGGQPAPHPPRRLLPQRLGDALRPVAQRVRHPLLRRRGARAPAVDQGRHLPRAGDGAHHPVPHLRLSAPHRAPAAAAAAAAQARHRLDDAPGDSKRTRASSPRWRTRRSSCAG